jgi:hypothetical protein
MRTLRHLTRTLAPAALLGALVAALPTSAQAGLGDLAFEKCQPLLGIEGEISAVEDGHTITLTAPDDGAKTCPEGVAIYSFAGNGAGAIDNHWPVVDFLVVPALEIEAAGVAGVTVPIQLDPCWPAVQVLRDGDSLVWQDSFGTGCAMWVSTDFVGKSWPTQIHVIQQTGTIMPPHIFNHVTDQTTALTGLPSGAYLVKVYDGATPGTTTSVDGDKPVKGSSVGKVAVGSHVEFRHPKAVGFSG